MFDIIEINSKDKTLTPKLAIGLDMSTSQANTDNKYKYLDMLSFADVVKDVMQITLHELEGDF